MILHFHLDEAHTKPKETEPAAPSSQPVSLAEQFKAKEGEWDCTFCYVRNQKDSTTCVACEQAKPGAQPQAQPKAEAVAKPQAKDSLAEMFKVR